MFKDRIGADCEKCRKQVRTLRAQNAEFSNVSAGGNHWAFSGYQSVNQWSLWRDFLPSTLKTEAAGLSQILLRI